MDTITGLGPVMLGVAAMGALHGLNPAAGWGIAAFLRTRSCSSHRSPSPLVFVGIGHALSLAAFAVAVALDVRLNPYWVGIGIGALALAAVVPLVTRYVKRRLDGPLPLGRFTLTLWSFAATMMHNVGLSLIPLMLPFCEPARDTTSVVSNAFAIAVLSIAVHTAAMLATAGLITSSVGQLCHRFLKVRRDAPLRAPER